MTRWLTALRRCITVIDDEPLIRATLVSPSYTYIVLYYIVCT